MKQKLLFTFLWLILGSLVAMSLDQSGMYYRKKIYNTVWMKGEQNSSSSRVLSLSIDDQHVIMEVETNRLYIEFQNSNTRTTAVMDGALRYLDLSSQSLLGASPDILTVKEKDFRDQQFTKDQQQLIAHTDMQLRRVAEYLGE